jgi:hypothetical protein
VGTLTLDSVESEETVLRATSISIRWFCRLKLIDEPRRHQFLRAEPPALVHLHGRSAPTYLRYGSKIFRQPTWL